MSRVSLQDSINPKPQSEGIAEEHPRQLAPSAGTLSAQGKASAIPVTSAAFVLESPTPPDPKDPIRCGSFEFVPHLKPPHSIPAESCDDMTATFGGVHFIIDSGGFLRLPRTNTSGSGPSVSADDTPAATLEIPPRNAQGGSRGSFDLTTGRKKRRRDLHRGEEERTAPHPCQSERGQEGVQPIHGRARSPYLSATEQLDAPCYLHSYIDPKDGREKSSHLLKNCRHFLEIRQFCDDLRGEAISRVHIMEKRARSTYPGTVGTNGKGREGALIEFLRERWEIFAWEPSDMPGIPRELAEHALNVDPTAKPVQQSMRRFSEPKRRAIGEEVNRLRKAGFIRELKEAEWVANPVMVPKKDTTALRMCIDYTGLNKHCPKDHFPLPRATYQRCMQACLGEQIGRNIEVYIDDIVVKTKHAATLIDDLRETFDNLDKYKIKLNPKKCFFGVPGGQVLGYFISARGIEANPLKIKAILDMEPPKNLHQVQQLAGRLAALSRFIAKLGEKALPFYNLMKKSEKFEWAKEAQESFDNLKKILSTSPVLVTPREKETLLMYIAATAQVFSSVLVVEREEA
ncbi:hypothetical protein QYE76_041623 [Lolium multiflorum]|uniref:Reverse transcriptase domain-containing protein n=1 Tax=Lolium multiflorum TaxID=4521 RepID=A0AAD8WU61_LOLMU|nr:hypothetical protein QYE76_041623 [Lolium multiflorum]